jgi:hypothetical protein
MTRCSSGQLRYDQWRDRNNIARLNPDGTLDGSFQNGLSGANGQVLSVAVESDGNVLIATGLPRSMACSGVSCAAVGHGHRRHSASHQEHQRSGAEVDLIWDALSNRTYRVQYKDNFVRKQLDGFDRGRFYNKRHREQDRHNSGYRQPAVLSRGAVAVRRFASWEQCSLPA